MSWEMILIPYSPQFTQFVAIIDTDKAYIFFIANCLSNFIIMCLNCNRYRQWLPNCLDGRGPTPSPPRGYNMPQVRETSSIFFSLISNVSSGKSG